jgi:hypothetical protein
MIMCMVWCVCVCVCLVMNTSTTGLCIYYINIKAIKVLHGKYVFSKLEYTHLSC